MELASLPFEGRVDAPFLDCYNRIDTMQNGTEMRLFSVTGGGQCLPTNGLIGHYMESYNGSVSIPLDIASAVEFPETCNGQWGKAKYKITFEISTGETYLFYFNTLDNNYGKSNWFGRNRYGTDWTIRYDDSLTIGHRVQIRGNGYVAIDSLYKTVSTTDTLNGQPTKEFKVWELLYNRQNPFGSRFYARTTPFGIAPSYVDNGFVRTLILGTDVILDTVYNNLGSDDRYGYNTELGNGTTIPNYFTNPPITPGANIEGETFCSPARKFPDPIYEFIYGMKITAEDGDTLTLKKRKKLWISGTNQLGHLEEGDTLELKNGSTVILERNAEIFQCFGGQIIQHPSSKIIWDVQSCMRAFSNSGMNFTGGTHTVNNGGFMVIDGNANLKLGDSTTLTFDGANTYLKLDPNSIVKLGQNAKLVFKNGAYLKANGATFNSYNNSSLWQGIVFENSGKDSVVNCVFSNAVTSLKILNSNSYAAQLRLIKNNIFNVPAGGKYGVYTLNCVNINLQDNTFNMPVTSGSYVGAYFQE